MSCKLHVRALIVGKAIVGDSCRWMADFSDEETAGVDSIYYYPIGGRSKERKLLHQHSRWDAKKTPRKNTQLKKYLLFFIALDVYCLGLLDQIHYVLVVGSADQDCLYAIFLGYQTARLRSESD